MKHYSLWPYFGPKYIQGFSLTELVVSMAVGSLVIIATTSVFGPQLRMHQKLETRTRMQERWARVNFLLDTEIQEAHTVALIPNGLRLTICEPASNIYTFSTRCSDAPTSTGTPGTDVTIDYVLNSSNQTLTRTGPPIKSNGELDPSSPSTSDQITTGVLLFNNAITNEAVTYTLSFRDPVDSNGPTYTQKASAARTRIKKL